MQSPARVLYFVPLDFPRFRSSKDGLEIFLSHPLSLKFNQILSKQYLELIETSSPALKKKNNGIKYYSTERLEGRQLRRAEFHWAGFNKTQKIALLLHPLRNVE